MERTRRPHPAAAETISEPEQTPRTSLVGRPVLRPRPVGRGGSGANIPSGHAVSSHDAETRPTASRSGGLCCAPAWRQAAETATQDALKQGQFWANGEWEGSDGAIRWAGKHKNGFVTTAYPKI